MAFQRMEIVKGRVCEIREAGDELVVTVKTGNDLRRIQGGAVINCTGPSESWSRSALPLHKNLLERGLVAVDPMDMGIQIAPDFSVTNKKGQTPGFLFALGPMLKGTLWESLAVPELRSQAFRVAETLARQLDGGRAVKLAEASEVIQEYEI